jgi:hypothetical protein
MEGNLSFAGGISIFVFVISSFGSSLSTVVISSGLLSFFSSALL